MELTDLKLKPKSKKEMKGDMPVSLGGENAYPYGFELQFDGDTAPKFPVLKKLLIGEKVQLIGTGEVTRIEDTKRTGGKDRFSISIQLMKVGVESIQSKKISTLADISKRMKKGE